MAIVKIPKTAFSRMTSLLGDVDIRDFFVFGGLAMLGYGLWMVRPWIGFAVPGAILMCFGLFVGKRGE